MNVECETAADSAFELEVCVDEMDEALKAVDAGATRIEMNRSLDRDGLTPEFALCRAVVEKCGVPVVAMLRPHDDGYGYESELLKQLVEECQTLLDQGVSGIAFGCLEVNDGRSGTSSLNFEALGQIKQVCGSRELVLHRVSDQVDLSMHDLRQLYDMGVSRILTSGDAATAQAGIARLKWLQAAAEEISQADKCLQILPGAGVNAENALEIIDRTGCRQLHGSFRLGGRRLDVAEIQETRRIMDAYWGTSNKNATDEI